ncbi:hypothetical protein C8Q80DRAFT_586228 [Daedaleopsis nitida]|nr:hypothetical protein C8Q80DRAFT_586228 [Daedaleopsis nitida]
MHTLEHRSTQTHDTACPGCRVRSIWIPTLYTNAIHMLPKPSGQRKTRKTTFARAGQDGAKTKLANQAPLTPEHSSIRHRHAPCAREGRFPGARMRDGRGRNEKLAERNRTCAPCFPRPTDTLPASRARRRRPREPGSRTRRRDRTPPRPLVHSPTAPVHARRHPRRESWRLRARSKPCSRVAASRTSASPLPNADGPGA